MAGEPGRTAATTFTGAVLTGGASRRMGRDKALIEHDGRPLAVRVATALLDAGAEHVTCVGGDVAGLNAVGLPATADGHPGEGPLGGILTALEHEVASNVVVVLAVDLARPDPVAIRAVVAAIDDATDLAVPVVDGRRQWLHAAWRRAEVVEVLRAAFESGERAVHRGVRGLRIREIEGLDAASLADVDGPADLTLLRDQK